MSYFSRTTLAISPFGQDRMSSDWTNLSQQWNSTSQTWLSTSSGNGHSFTGSGYIWGLISPDNSLGYHWATYSVGSSSAGQEKLGLSFHPSNSYAWVSDQTFLNYGNNTSYHRHFSPYTAFYATSASRVNVIRIEP